MSSALRRYLGGSYTLAAKLVNELVEAADDKQLTQAINGSSRVDRLRSYELGYTELDKCGAELFLFQVSIETEERQAWQSFPTNLSLGGRITFADPKLCATIVDRLTFGGKAIETATGACHLTATGAVGR